MNTNQLGPMNPTTGNSDGGKGEREADGGIFVRRGKDPQQQQQPEESQQHPQECAAPHSDSLVSPRSVSARQHGDGTTGRIDDGIFRPAPTVVVVPDSHPEEQDLSAHEQPSQLVQQPQQPQQPQQHAPLFPASLVSFSEDYEGGGGARAVAAAAHRGNEMIEEECLQLSYLNEPEDRDQLVAGITARSSDKDTRWTEVDADEFVGYQQPNAVNLNATNFRSYDLGEDDANFDDDNEDDDDDDDDDDDVAGLMEQLRELEEEIMAEVRIENIGQVLSRAPVALIEQDEDEDEEEEEEEEDEDVEEDEDEEDDEEDTVTPNDNDQLRDHDDFGLLNDDFSFATQDSLCLAGERLGRRHPRRSATI